LSDLQDTAAKGGAAKDPDLPDNVEHIYVSTKNTWQDAENLDDVHGYVSYIWVPEETFRVNIMKLHVYAEKFRAHSKAALSKDLGTKTSTVETPSHTHNVVIGAKTSAAAGSHKHKMFDYLSAGAGGWSLDEYNCYDVVGNVLRVDVAVNVKGKDLYTYETAPAHTHDVDYGTKTSEAGAGAHSHDVPIGSHDHAIDFGIYEEAIAGRTLSAKLYDPDGQLVKDFGVILTGESDLILDLSQYFGTLKYGMYRLELSASARLRARLVFYELCLMYAY